MPQPSSRPMEAAPTRSLPLPPVPRGYPLVGVLPQMARDPLRFSAQLIRQYGDIVSLDLKLAKVYLIGHPDLAQYVLRDHAANFTKDGGMWDALRLLGGDGLGTSDGEVWRQQRRMMQPLFHRQRLAGLPPLITGAVKESIAPWETAAAEHRPFDVAHAMEHITMRVILKTICSVSISDAEIEALSQAIGVAFRFIGVRMWTYFLPPWLPLPGSRGFREALQTIDRIIYRIINDRRQKPAVADDLLTLLLNARDEVTEKGMSDRQIRDEVVGFYVAGYETVATALSWTLHLICQHPEVEQKLRAELEAVLGGRTPGFAELGQLTYTKMVFQESMRLYPPAWVLPRRAVAEDVVGGYRIPRDAIVAILFYAIQRHPLVWAEPEAFKPERFADESKLPRARCAYLPFGAGARQCIGSNFALMEGPLVLAMLLQRFRMRSWPGHKVEPEGNLALRPRHGVLVSLERLPNLSPTATSSSA